MHWYQVGGEVSICECQSSRARLPPSRFVSFLYIFDPLFATADGMQVINLSFVSYYFVC